VKVFSLKPQNQMKSILVLILSFLLTSNSFAQTQSYPSFFHPNPPYYTVKHALEVESLFPMFLYGGFHGAVGYRYKKFRVRFSVINGGTYNAENAGINNNSGHFKRFYKTSPGIFLGYNVWRNLDVYTYLESHTFSIEQRSTGVKHDIKSIDYGLATSYQLFIGPIFYVQPGLHLYLRKANSSTFDDEVYHIPTADFSVVVRVGARLWSKY